MKNAVPPILRLRSIAEQHQLLALPKPAYPLLSVLRFEDFPVVSNATTMRFTMEYSFTPTFSAATRLGRK